MTDKKLVTSAQHLQMLALFTIAKQHADKAQQFYDALKEMAGDGADHFADALWGNLGEGFDDAFRKAGFAVRKETSASPPSGAVAEDADRPAVASAASHP